MISLPMVYGFVIPLAAAFVVLFIVSAYRFYRKKETTDDSRPIEVNSKTPYFMASPFSSPAFTPFGSTLKENGDSNTSNISRKNIRVMYSPNSATAKDRLNEAQLTATSPVLAAALEDVLRLSREVFELKNARASLRQLQTPSRKGCSSFTDEESPLDSVLALASPSPDYRQGAEDPTKEQWTEIDLGDTSSTAVWVRTDSITFV
ncbi:uncharacterized protein LOC125032591 [Penaeus chinensis]|uniref:uncharacterized protein LOC125032591 n=1 Tax=Penaeus chinensis TaxID=139456 RepID=UPI001FB81C1C|nr:uncharacterized protein LOC125032591 [Penaeus chinensis]